jgi:hypothetical protein
VSVEVHQGAVELTRPISSLWTAIEPDLRSIRRLS